MSSLLPLAAYNLAIEPFVPTQAIESDLPMTIRITMAAIDPNATIDDEEQPSTLRILKSSPLSRLAYDSDDEEEDFNSEDDSESGSEEEQDDEEMEEDDEEEKEEGDDSEEENDSEDDSDFDDDDVEEYVVCTLSPKHQFQQTLDITISPEEEIFFVVTGSYPVHLSGNYVEHPFDGEGDEFDSEDSEEDSDFDSDEYDLTPDEEELAEGDFDVNDLEDEEDIEGKIEELVEEDEKKSKKEPKKDAKKDNKKEKDSKKRQAEEETAKPEVKETKKQKKTKEQEEKKSVQFNQELEQGPTKSEKKPAVKTLAGGVTVEDRTVGKGPQAKNGAKIGMRYIGKLKNGSVFDKNTSGKPFQFTLGKGEVIKGWDIGVAGMAVGGERRIVIPPAFAYGKKKLPGIPANSELTFDVKLVSLK